MTIPEISSLIGQIKQTDPSNLEQRARLLSRIRELRDLLQQGSTKDSVSFLEAASLLLEYIPPYGVEPNYLTEIVARLVSMVDGRVEHEPADSADSAGPAEPPGATGASNEPPQPEAEPKPAMRVEPSAKTPARPRGGLTKIRLSEEGSSSSSLRLLNELLFGEVMVQLGTIKKPELEAALRVQSATGKRLGEVLVETGAATYEQIQCGLKAQEQLQHSAALSKSERGLDDPFRPGPPKSALRKTDNAEELLRSAPPAIPIGTEASGRNMRTIADVLFGEMLIKLQLITPEQLRKGLELQRATGNRIGETLVELNFISWKQVQDAYALQRAKRKQAGIRG